MDREQGSLDQQRWIELWSRLGAQSNGVAVFNQLASAYDEPARAYHTAQHIRDCLEELDLHRNLALFPDEVEAALWFHDAVYRPASSDNEEQSASLARTALTSGGIPAEPTRRIAQLVLATSHRREPVDPDEQLICDIDLAVLGRAPKSFDEFERQIRREYAWVPQPVYRRERSRVLSEFLSRRSIYQTTAFFERYEEPARANLRRLVKHLGG